MTTADPTAGPQIVSGDHDEAGVNYDAMLREIEALRSQLAEAREMAAVDAEIIDDLRAVLGLSPGQSLTKAVTQLRDDLAQLRSQLAEAREQRDQAAEALVRAETERDEARAEIARLERAAHEQGADLWIAEDRLDWLRRQVLAVAEDLERYASDLRFESLERRLAWTLRQIVAGERPEACRCGKPAEPGHCSHCHDDPPAQTVADALDDAVGHLRDMLLRALATTAPETGLSATQTDEQAQVRTDTHTRAETGSDGPWTPAWCRTQMQRLCIAASESGLRWRDYDVVGAVIAEIDRLRTEAAMLRAEREWLADRARTMGIAEAIIAAHGPAHAVSAEAGRLRAKVKHLSARVREWEAVNADLAARCDSGDIPTRLGERYSLAVLREIDRLRTERDRLRRRLGDVLDLEELPEDHTIVAAVRRLRAALGSAPDTGSTT